MSDQGWQYVLDENGDFIHDEDGDPLVSDGMGEFAVLGDDGELYEVGDEISQALGASAGETIVDLLDKHPGAADWIHENYPDEPTDATDAAGAPDAAPAQSVGEAIDQVDWSARGADEAPNAEPAAEPDESEPIP